MRDFSFPKKRSTCTSRHCKVCVFYIKFRRSPLTISAPVLFSEVSRGISDRPGRSCGVVSNQDPTSSLNIFPVHYALTPKNQQSKILILSRDLSLSTFLFCRFRKIRHVCPSVCTHGITRLPLDRFL